MTKYFRIATVVMLTTALAAPLSAANFNRNAAPDYVEDWGTIAVGDAWDYELFASGGSYAYVDLGSNDCYADLDVVVYNSDGLRVAEGTSPYCSESISWYVEWDQVYYVEISSYEGSGTDFYLYAWSEWGH